MHRPITIFTRLAVLLAVLSLIGAPVIGTAAADMRSRPGKATSANGAPLSTVFATYLGGSGTEWAESVATDASGNVYVAGHTYSHDIPAERSNTIGPRGSADVFVAKLDPAGSKVEFVTYVGGSGADVQVGSQVPYLKIGLDAQGNIYVAACTTSADFPGAEPPDGHPSGDDVDVFLFELDPTGTTLSFATYVGGHGGDHVTDMAVTPEGDVVLTGLTNSPDFPITTGEPPAGEAKSFLTRLSPARGGVVWSVMGGRFGGGVAVDAAGTAYATQHPTATSAPALVKVSPDGAVSYSAWHASQAENLIVDGDAIYFTYGSSINGDSLIAGKVSVDGEIAWATGINAANDDLTVMRSIALDATGHLWVVQYSFQDAGGDSYSDGTVLRFDDHGRYSFGAGISDGLFGVAADPGGGVVTVGMGGLESTTLLVNPLQPQRAGGWDAFVARFAFPAEIGALPVISEVRSVPRRSAPGKFRYVVKGANFQPGALVFFGDGNSPFPLRVKSASKIAGGSSDLPITPGIAVTVVNPDGGSATTIYAPEAD